MNGKELNELRKMRKLSISKLADLANLPKATVEKVLYGITKNPGIETVNAILIALNEQPIPVGENAITGPLNQSTTLTPDERELLELFNSFGPFERETCLEQTRALAKLSKEKEKQK